MQSIEPVYAVLDTNDFLEHRRFTEIPWLKVLTTKRAVLVVPWKVVSELDANKSNNKSATKRERARALLPLIERYSQLEPGAEVRDGVTMEYLHGNVEEMCRQHDLTPSEPDQVIIASALLQQERTPDARVVLVTGDTGMRMSGRRVGVEIIEMPKEFRLPHALDADEQEKRQMERELQRIQARQPKLFVGWGEDAKAVLRVRVSTPSLQTDSEIDDAVKNRVDRIKEGRGTVFVPTRDDVLADFSAAYRTYLLHLRDFHRVTSLSVSTKIGVRNDGTKPATDLRLELYFPQNVTVFGKLPTMPVQPAAPSGFSISSGFISRPIYQVPNILSSAMSAVTKRDTHSWVEDGCVILRVDKLRQSYLELTSEFYIGFEDVTHVCAFKVDYHLITDELLDPLEGSISVVPQLA